MIQKSMKADLGIQQLYYDESSLNGLNCDSLTDVAKKTIDNACNEYIRICHNTEENNENPIQSEPIESPSLSELDKNIIEAANKINPVLGDIISKIPKYKYNLFSI